MEEEHKNGKADTPDEGTQGVLDLLCVPKDPNKKNRAWFKHLCKACWEGSDREFESGCVAIPEFILKVILPQQTPFASLICQENCEPPPPPPVRESSTSQSTSSAEAPPPQPGVSRSRSAGSTAWAPRLQAVQGGREEASPPRRPSRAKSRSKSPGRDGMARPGE